MSMFGDIACSGLLESLATKVAKWKKKAKNEDFAKAYQKVLDLLEDEAGEYYATDEVRKAIKKVNEST